MAATLISGKLGTIYAEAQSAMGTAVSDMEGADAFKAWDIAFEPRGELTIKRDQLSGPYGGACSPPVIGSIGWKITFKTEFPKGIDTGTATNFGPIYDLWRACKLGVSSPTTDTVLVPVSGNADQTDVFPVTFDYEEVDGTEYRAVDCVGVITSIDGEMGKPLVVSWEFHGLWVAPVSDGILTPVFTAYTPVVCKNCTLTTTQLGTALGLSKFSISLGQTITETVDGTKAQGLGPSFVEYSTYPTLAFTVGAQAESAYTVWADWLAVTDCQISLSISDGGSAVFAIAFAAEYLDTPKAVKVGEYRAYDLVALATTSSSGNDQFTITLVDT